MNPDVDISDWDSVAEKTFNDFQEASILHNVEIHQFSIRVDEETNLGLADQLLALYQGDLTRDELITWITENYVDGTTQE